MNELLTYLVSRLSFLYDEYDARFVDSQVRGPDAVLVLEAARLRIRLVRDRSQIFIDFQCVENRSKDEWFSFDVVRQLLTGEIVDSAVMSDEKARFIHHHFPAIIEAFSSPKRVKTEEKLNEFEHARARRLFG